MGGVAAGGRVSSPGRFSNDFQRLMRVDSLLFELPKTGPEPTDGPPMGGGGGRVVEISSSTSSTTDAVYSSFLFSEGTVPFLTSPFVRGLGQGLI